MHQFRNDYSEGACPEVLEALIQTNAEQTPGYGTDEHCERAAALLREVCGQPDAYVRFIPGGTAANAVCISAFTDDFEGPILAADAHPTAHETGAIEACGRRILATADAFGVLAPAEVERVYHASIAGGCHTTRPAMLYFSNTSELGHVYTRAEFDSLCDVAEKLDLAVYVDGARMASALTAADGDLTLEHLARRCLHARWYQSGHAVRRSPRSEPAHRTWAARNRAHPLPHQTQRAHDRQGPPHGHPV